jgi:hypothetical protein
MQMCTTTERRARVINTAASYSERPGFKNSTLN